MPGSNNEGSDLPHFSDCCHVPNVYYFFFFGMASIAQILSHSYKHLEICSLSSSQNVFSCPIYSNLSKLHILVKAFFLFFFLAISSIIKYFLLILFKFFFSPLEHPEMRNLALHHTVSYATLCSYV